MQFQLSGVPGNVISKLGFHSRRFGSINLQSISKLRENHKELLSKLLDRRWALPHPDTQIHRISLSEREEEHGDVPNFMFAFSNNTRPSLGGSLKEKRKEVSFSVVRDDLLHPFVNGNKARKLDGLLPLLEDHLVTDVVTCGGCQSAHAASVAVSCAERGLRSHLLLRGEQPEIPTGYNLISTMYGNVTYVPRSLYAEREEMLSRHADLVAGTNGSVIWLDNILDTPLWAQESEKAKFVPLDGNQIVFTQLDAKEHPRKVAIVNEGAGDAVALLGLSEDLWSLNIEKDLLIRYTILHRVIRIVEYLSRPPLFGGDQVLKIVVDAGTGTTAVGLGLGAVCLGLPWEVCGVMLANSIEGYKKQEKHLINEFKRLYGIGHVGHAWNGVDGGIVHWVERTRPRKFGNILKGEVEMCRQIAQQTGILVDPVYTLAAWEHAMLLCRRQIDVDAQVVMLHTGGTLGMFGLAQRYKSFFHRIQ